MRHGPDPAVPWVVAALLGAWLGWDHPGAVGAVGVVSVALVAVLLAARARRGVIGRAVAVLAVAVVLAAVAGAQRGALDWGPVARLADRGGAADVEAVVAVEPAPTRDGRWWTILRVGQVDSRGSGERVLLHGEGPPPPLGSRLSLRATARPLGDEGFDDHLRRRHVAARVDPVRPPSLVAPPGRVLASTEVVRSRVRAAAATGLRGDRAGLAVGLVTGDTRLLDPRTVDRLQAVGLSHLVAVSGSNVAVVLAGLALVTGLFGIGARGRRWVVVVGVAWFVLLTRAEPSVLRAAAMVGVVLVAQWRGVGADPVHALAVAVLVLVALDPALAGSLGLLLSAAATAGVLVVAPRVASRLHRCPPPLAVLVAVSVGAQVAVAPILLATLGDVPLASVPANLVAVPAAVAGSAVAMAASVVACLDVGAGAVLFAVADLPLRVILAAAHLPDLPLLSWARPASLVGSLALVAWAMARRGSRTARLAATLTIAVGASLLTPVGGGAPGVLTVTAIDVGQGDAVLVEGGGARILVDGGPDEATALTWLRRRGIRRLDLVVASHPHADHVVGLAAVVATLDVGAVWLRPIDPAAPDEVRAAAMRRSIPVHEPVAGQVARVGTLDVHVLSPPRGSPFAGSDGEANDMSLVLRVDQGRRRALLTGDAELAAQAHLLTRPSILRAGLLKVPHHGGATSDPTLFAVVDAELALVSVGRDNRYGHPHPAVLAALVAEGMQVRRTDLEGSVTVTVPPLAEGVGRAARDGHVGGLRSPHVHRPPADGRRRPAAPAGDRTPARRSHRRRPRAGGRDARCLRARRPAGTADPVPVRRPRVRGDPGSARGARGPAR